jgi:hypothetical protein
MSLTTCPVELQLGHSNLLRRQDIVFFVCFLMRVVAHLFTTSLAEWALYTKFVAGSQ